VIYVRIEIWPCGDRRSARTLGEATIANVGGTAQVGEYDAKIMKSPEYATRPGVWKQAKISGFPRLKLGPWELVCMALLACLGKRLQRAGASEEVEHEPGAMEAIEVSALRLPVPGRPEPLVLR
jgi:hypothetical protein